MSIVVPQCVRLDNQLWRKRPFEAVMEYKLAAKRNELPFTFFLYLLSKRNSKTCYHSLSWGGRKAFWWQLFYYSQELRIGNYSSRLVLMNNFYWTTEDFNIKLYRCVIICYVLLPSCRHGLCVFLCPTVKKKFCLFPRQWASR